MLFILVPCVRHAFPYISQYIAYKNVELLVLCTLGIHNLPQNPGRRERQEDRRTKRVWNQKMVISIKIIFHFFHLSLSLSVPPPLFHYFSRSLCHSFSLPWVFFSLFFRCVLFCWVARHSTEYNFSVVLCLLSCVYEHLRIARQIWNLLTAPKNPFRRIIYARFNNIPRVGHTQSKW